MIGTEMVSDGRTAREYFAHVMENPVRDPFGFGEKLAIINVDIQKAYTSVEDFNTAYVTDPRQIEYVNTISRLARRKNMPVIWTHVGYRDDGADCGVWGTISDTADALQNIKMPSRRYEFDDRCEIDSTRDAIYTKRMPSCFFETPLASYLIWNKVDTVVVTGGSTSGCVRATVVDALSHGYRPIVPIETTADKHESPHFANLTDMALKYADVVSVQRVIDWLESR